MDIGKFIYELSHNLTVRIDRSGDRMNKLTLLGAVISAFYTLITYLRDKTLELMRNMITQVIHLTISETVSDLKLPK